MEMQIKINLKYEKEICEYWSKEFNTTQSLDSLFGKEDTDGYRECQTWIFMKYISPFINIGEPPFETTVYFEMFSEARCDFLEKENTEQKKQIEKMINCSNCKHNKYIYKGDLKTICEKLHRKVDDCILNNYAYWELAE